MELDAATTTAMIDASSLMPWAGCVLGVAGSIALARNDRYSGWGFVAYLASSAAWLAYGYISDIPALALQHSVFAAVSSFGVWRWLVLPRIKAGALGRDAPALTSAASVGSDSSTP